MPAARRIHVYTGTDYEFTSGRRGRLCLFCLFAYAGLVKEVHHWRIRAINPDNIPHLTMLL